VSLPPIAAAVRANRLRSGLTLEQLADAGGVCRSTLSKIEAGATIDPGFGVVARLLGASGADNEEVLALHAKFTPRVPSQVIGLGYEGLDQAGLISHLQQQRVDVVVDVRLTPLSRKKGLSKTALREGLGAASIDYVHLAGLGNPKDNRAGYSDPENQQVRDTFRTLLQREQSVQQLEQLRQMARERTVALLCFEKDEQVCHRQQVLAALA
jgi:transcriptional regulator with XRE-family HTH domain